MLRESKPLAPILTAALFAQLLISGLLCIYPALPAVFMLFSGQAAKEGSMQGCLLEVSFPPAATIIVILALIRIKAAIIAAGFVQFAFTSLLIYAIYDVHRSSNRDDFGAGLAELIIGVVLLCTLPATVIWCVHLFNLQSRTRRWS